MSQILSNINFVNSFGSKTSKFEPSHSDKNDIFYIFTKTIDITDKFFSFLFSSISFLIQIIFSKKFFVVPRMCFYSIFFFLLFSLSQSKNIPTELIIAAYFNNSKIIHISYDKILKSNKNIYENKLKKNNEAIYQENYNNYDEYNPNNNLCCGDNNIYRNYNDNDKPNNEFNFFKFFQVKKIFVTFLAFFSLYIVIKMTYYSRITNSIIINLFGVYCTFKIMSYLYFSQYYLASGFIFVLFFYFYKFAIDSLYSLLKFKKCEFEIYSVQLCAENVQQFWLKFNILFSGTILSGVLSIIYFNLYFNYIAFYMCLFTLIIFLCNCLEKNYLVEYKYSKNIFIFIFGNINFIINKFLRKKYYNINNSQINNIFENNDINNHICDINSFYFISDLFSLLCFDYIDDYIEYKYQNYLSKTKKFKKIFNIHDMIFIFLFFVFIIINIYGVIFKEYASYYLAMTITKKFNNYFPSIFHYSIGRIFNHLMILVFIFSQYEISTTGDEYMINVLLNINLGRNTICVILKFFSLCMLFFNLLHSNYLYYYSDDCHQNLYHYFKTFDIFKDFNDMLQQEYNEFNNDNDDSMDDEEDFINFNFNTLNNFYKKKYKIKIIANKSADNKTKDNLLAADFSLCYIDLSLTIVFAIYYEYNLFIKITYLIIILFLLSRKFYLLNEIKGKFLYFIYYIISFIFSSRLIFLTCIDSALLAFIMQLNMFALLGYYCFNGRRNYFITFVILIHLMIAYYKKNFTFFLFDFVFVVLALIFKNFKNKETFKIEKYDEQDSRLSLIFLLSLVMFFLIQLYGINKLFYLVQSFYNYIMDYFNKINLMLSSKDNDDIRLIEYYFITDIIDWIDHKLQ